MEIRDLEKRLKQCEDILTKVADGNFDQKLELSHQEDALNSLEMGINFMLLDLKAMDEANAEKERQLREQASQLEEKLITIDDQAEAIRELSTPVIEIWEDILVLPVVGVLDTKRSMEIMNNLLGAIVDNQCKFLIIDITGVEIVDTRTADYLLKVSRAAKLLGTRCVLTGLSPAVAQTLVEIGADLNELRTLRNLKDGLRDCLIRLKQQKLGQRLDASTEEKSAA